jgi:lipid-A-disaccharide synthase
MGKVMLVAGEVSGDMNAANVVREIKKMAPETEFYGMGLNRMEAEGVKILINPASVSTIGFSEALKNIRVHLEHVRILKEHMDRERPDVLFLVDYSGFNMRMAQIARKRNIAVVNYFSPSAWIWGKWRARWMARNKAIIAAVFPIEAEVYRKAGARVHYVGHPLIDQVRAEDEINKILNKYELDPDKPRIGLLPGSRITEVEMLLPEMLKAAEALQIKNKDIQFLLPLADGLERSHIAEIGSSYNLIFKIIEDDTYNIMNISDLIIVASGTATLEAALLETPMIIVYKTSPSTYFLGKRLINSEFIGLPNIIASKKLVPELMQKEAKWENIYQETMNLLNKTYQLNIIRGNLADLKKELGPGGAVRRTAELVLKAGNIQ